MRGLPTVIAVLLVSGCGSGTPSLATPSLATPSLAAPASLPVWPVESAMPAPSPSPTPTRTPPATPTPAPTARPCTAADLPHAATTDGESGMAGNLLHFVQLRPTGRTSCTLHGYPALTGAGGRTIPVDDGTGLGPDHTVATVRPGGRATVAIVTSESCDGGIDPTTYADVHVIVAGKSLAVPGLALVTTCPVRVGTWFIQ